MKSYGLFYFWRMYELFHRFYRYKFVGEIAMNETAINWDSIPDIITTTEHVYRYMQKRLKLGVV